jgi:hypothetical protein
VLSKDLVTDMPDNSSLDETRMRAMLGLNRDSQLRPAEHRPEQSPHRRRFVRDGEVLVTVVNAATSENVTGESLRGRLRALEQALRAERESHVRTKHALDDARGAMQALETKCAHIELAHAEAIQNERSARTQAEAAVERLQAQLHAVEERGRQLEAAPAPKPPKVKRAAGQVARAPRRSKEATSAPEPEPVQWWLPGWKTGKTRR